jgi:hypothetical protein
MCTSGGNKPFTANMGKYIQNAGFVPNNANPADIPGQASVPPITAQQRAFQQTFGPYALGRDFIIPTGNVRSR